MLFQLRDRGLVGAAEHQRRLVGRQLEPPYDLGDLIVVQRNELPQPFQHRAERVLGGRQELDGEAGDVIGDRLSVPVEDEAARGRQSQAPQPVGLGAAAELLVLQHLGPEEIPQQGQKGPR